MKKNSILLILAIGMMSGGFYNDTFAANGTEQTVADQQHKERVLKQQDADRLIEEMKARGSTELVIPEGYKSINERAFYKCTGLTSIVIPDSVTSIGSGAFNGCTGLKSIVIPGSVKYIGFGAFGVCKKLSSITIPSTLEHVGMMVFDGCKNLKTINIANDKPIMVEVEGKKVNINSGPKKVNITKDGTIETNSKSLEALLKSCRYDNKVKCNIFTKGKLRSQKADTSVGSICSANV